MPGHSHRFALSEKIELSGEAAIGLTRLGAVRIINVQSIYVCFSTATWSTKIDA